ncbi:MAG: NADPH:quinone reductase [Pseudomonadota bacterium]
MKAAFYEHFGTAADVLVVGDKPIGKPAEGEVQIRMMASGVNPSDVKKRAGARGEMTDAFVIPHSDGAGIVQALGAGVDQGWLNQRVWVCEAQHGRALGAAAEQVNLPIGMIATLPDNTSFAEGAAIPIPMMTAHRCLTSAGEIEGLTVLVTGAMGRVGHYAVQMAREMGARVVATVGSEEDLAEVRALGVTEAVNFRDTDHFEQLLEMIGPSTVDRVVDVEFGANLLSSLPLLKDNAVIASYASGREPMPQIDFYALMFRNIFVHPVLVYSMPAAAKVSAKASINAMLSAEKIVHRINHTLPLDDIARAHELVEAGARGAVIVESGDAS